MTAPVPHGYPDWQPQRPVADTVLNREVSTVVVTTVTRGPFFVGNFPAIGLDFSATVGRITLELQFFEDEAATLPMGEAHILSTPGQFFQGGVRVNGPWVRAVARNEQVADSAVRLVMWSQAWAGMRQEAPGLNILIRTAGASIASGATLTTEAGRIWGGPASLSFGTTAVDNDIRLETLRFDGVWQRFLLIRDLLNITPSTIYLPTAPVRAILTNGDAAARFFDMSLIGNVDALR